MSNQKCPLKGLTDTTHPSEVSNVKFLSSVPDQNGGCSKNQYLCLVCNREFEMTEDISYHYPHYYWPGKCVRNQVDTPSDSSNRPVEEIGGSNTGPASHENNP